MKFSKKFQELAKHHNIDLFTKLKEFLGFKQLSFLMWRIDFTGNNKENLVEWLKYQVEHRSNDLKQEAKRFQEISDLDKRILAILRFVNNRTTYVRDSVRWAVPEKWQDAETTYSIKTGDCEDQSILVFVLARLSGITSDRIRLVTGNVVTANGICGHCWVSYDNMFGQEYYIDSTYYVDFTEIKERPQAQFLEYYKSVWFYVNDQSSWRK